jgi:hypothetical protein
MRLIVVPTPPIQAWMWHEDAASCDFCFAFAELLLRRVKGLDLHSHSVLGAANCLSSASMFGPLDAIPSHPIPRIPNLRAYAGRAA